MVSLERHVQEPEREPERDPQRSVKQLIADERSSHIDVFQEVLRLDNQSHHLQRQIADTLLYDAAHQQVRSNRGGRMDFISIIVVWREVVPCGEGPASLCMCASRHGLSRLHARQRLASLRGASRAEGQVEGRPALSCTHPEPHCSYMGASNNPKP